MVEELKKLTTRVAHVLPVSDDGGSTAEIVRVLGSLSYPNLFKFRRSKSRKTVERILVIPSRV